MNEKVNEIVSLIEELCDAGISQIEIAHKVREYSSSSQLMNTDKTKINKIKNGVYSFSRSKKFIPEWIDVLKRIRNERILKYNVGNITGVYLGFYHDVDIESFRPLILVLDQDSARLTSSHRDYYGKYTINCESLIITGALASGKRPFVFFSCIDVVLDQKNHADVLIFHYSYESGRGVKTGRCMFFYLDDTPIDGFDEAQLFSRYENEYASLMKKAQKYLGDPIVIETKKTRLEVKELK